MGVSNRVDRVPIPSAMARYALLYTITNPHPMKSYWVGFNGAPTGKGESMPQSHRQCGQLAKFVAKHWSQIFAWTTCYSHKSNMMMPYGFSSSSSYHCRHLRPIQKPFVGVFRFISTPVYRLLYRHNSVDMLLCVAQFRHCHHPRRCQQHQDSIYMYIPPARQKWAITGTIWMRITTHTVLVQPPADGWGIGFQVNNPEWRWFHINLHCYYVLL